MTIQLLIKTAGRLEAYQKASHLIFEIRNYSSAESQKRRLVDYFLQ